MVHVKDKREMARLFYLSTTLARGDIRPVKAKMSHKELLVLPNRITEGRGKAKGRLTDRFLYGQKPFIEVEYESGRYSPSASRADSLQTGQDEQGMGRSVQKCFRKHQRKKTGVSGEQDYRKKVRG